MLKKVQPIDPTQNSDKDHSHKTAGLISKKQTQV
jgi:hypothetical protein